MYFWWGWYENVYFREYELVRECSVCCFWLELIQGTHKIPTKLHLKLLRTWESNSEKVWKFIGSIVTKKIWLSSGVLFRKWGESCKNIVQSG